MLSRGKLKSSKASSDDIKEAVEIVNAWRVAHSYPLNTFNVNLRKKVRGLKAVVVAQRLKRMPTILDKLVREPTMELTNMQDIGGVRAILKNPKDVYRIVKKYQNTPNHELLKEKDYINTPRGSDGYRSYHLTFRYKNNIESAEQYNGLRIEVQLRTQLQHKWATAVETMGVILGQQLKSRQGEKEWLEFFCSVSNAFAHIENTTLVPGYESLSRQAAFELVREKEGRLNAIEKFTAFSRAMEFVNRDGNKRGRPRQGYYLLKLDLKDHSIVISTYTRDDATRASTALENLEKQAQNNPNIDALLVSVGPLDELRKAYPNYFLDVGEFIDQLRSVIRMADSANS